jgi:hypothetical protein
VFLKSPLYVNGYARIERPVGAFEDVEEIHDEYLQLLTKLSCRE